METERLTREAMRVFAEEKHAECRRLLGEALRIDGGFVPALLLLRSLRLSHPRRAFEMAELARDDVGLSAEALKRRIDEGSEQAYAAMEAFLAADRSSATGAFLNGVWCELARGENSRAEAHYATAAAQGLAAAKCNLGVMRERAKDHAGAAALYREAAQTGHATARLNIAMRMLNETATSEREAVAVLRDLAENDRLSAAQFSLGWCIANGCGVDARDPAAAVALYRAAAAQGHAKAQRVLGQCLQAGSGCAVDTAGAAVQYELAAKQGDAEAQYLLAWCFQNGCGVARDPSEAVLLLHLAA
jgi:TPR repeat protein